MSSKFCRNTVARESTFYSSQNSLVLRNSEGIAPKRTQGRRTLQNKTETEHWNSLKQFQACYCIRLTKGVIYCRDSLDVVNSKRTTRVFLCLFHVSTVRHGTSNCNGVRGTKRWKLLRSFVKNVQFILYSAVKEFWKSVKICESYCQTFGGFLFWDMVYSTNLQ